MNVLLGQLLAVKPMAPAQVLADERYRHGCLIGVQLGHVEIVHKVHQLFVARRAIVDTSLQTDAFLHSAIQGLLAQEPELASRYYMHRQRACFTMLVTTLARSACIWQETLTSVLGNASNAPCSGGELVPPFFREGLPESFGRRSHQ